ncbi:MAG: hypothetical protein ACO3IN_10695 [Steroidobacteraceae bacterium]
MRRPTRSSWLWVGLLVAGCGGGGGGDPDPRLPSVLYSHDFATGAGGWLTDSADYTPETAPEGLVAESRPLPEPFTGLGLYLAGTNRSDDLFIYGKTKVSGLSSGATYRAAFRVTVLTQVPAGCIGVGGAPGESVWIAVGLSQAEPLTVLENGEYRVNIPRGNQSTGGEAGEVLGDITTTITNCAGFEWQSKTLVSAAPPPLTVTADSRGEVWILVGMDSGFESFSEIYLRTVGVEFTPVDRG